MKVFFTRLFLLVWLIIQVVALDGQDVRLKITSLTEDDGLDNNYIRDVMRDHRGLMWIATEGGLHSYDGFSFTLYNDDKDSPIVLNSRRIRSVIEDEEGNVWIGTDNGLNVIDIETNEVRSYLDKDNKLYKSKGIIKNSITLEKGIDGKIWINDGGKLCTFQGDSLYYYDLEIPDFIVRMKCDGKGRVYLGYGNSSISIIDKEGKPIKTFIDVPYLEQPKNQLPHTVFLDDSGDWVIQILDDRYYKIDSTFEKFIRFTPEPNSIPGLIRNFNKSFYEEDFSRFALVRKDVLFHMMDVFQDDNGLLWLATNFGLVKLSYELNDFTKSEVLKGVSLRAMLEVEDGSIYMGSYEPNSFLKYDPIKDEIHDFEITTIWPMIHLNKDTLLLGSASSGVYLFDLNQEAIVFEKNYGPRKNGFHSLLMDQDGERIWMGGLQNLFFVHKDSLNAIEVYQTPEGEAIFEGIMINHMVKDNSDESIWVGSSKGLYHIHKDKGVLATYLQSNGESHILNDEIQQLYQDKKGNIWTATYGGLNYINKISGEVKAYTSEDGIPDDYVYTMINENDTRLWLGTRSGLSRFDIESETFFNFYESDGLPYREFNRGSAMRTRAGRIYLGGLSGFTSFDPANIVIKKNGFKPFISKYIIYDADIKGQKKVIPNSNHPGKVYLNPNNRNIEIWLAVSNYENPKKAKFQARLEGFDDEWVDLGNKRTIRYTNLDAGAYTFNARAADKNGLWSQEYISFDIIVREPFWGSDLFIGIILLLILGMGIAFYFSRLSYETKSNELRNRIANDLHDEVSNTLNNIRIISAEAQMEGKGSKELSRIKHMSSNAIEHVQDVIWAIDHDKQNIKFLVFRMEDYVDLLLRANQIPVTFTKENLNLDSPLDFLHRRNLLLIFKEAISNIVKHTNSDRVDIAIGNRNNQFFLSCVNHYTSLKIHKYRTGRGVPSMIQRAEAINGKLDIIENKDSFEVKLLLKKVL